MAAALQGYLAPKQQPQVAEFFDTSKALLTGPTPNPYILNPKSYLSSVKVSINCLWCIPCRNAVHLLITFHYGILCCPRTINQHFQGLGVPHNHQFNGNESVDVRERERGEKEREGKTRGYEPLAIPPPPDTRPCWGVWSHRVQ